MNKECFPQNLLDILSLITTKKFSLRFGSFYFSYTCQLQKCYFILIISPYQIKLLFIVLRKRFTIQRFITVAVLNSDGLRKHCTLIILNLYFKSKLVDILILPNAFSLILNHFSSIFPFYTLWNIFVFRGYKRRTWEWNGSELTTVLKSSLTFPNLQLLLNYSVFEQI